MLRYRLKANGIEEEQVKTGVQRFKDPSIKNARTFDEISDCVERDSRFRRHASYCLAVHEHAAYHCALLPSDFSRILHEENMAYATDSVLRWEEGLHRRLKEYLREISVSTAQWDVSESFVLRSESFTLSFPEFPPQCTAEHLAWIPEDLHVLSAKCDLAAIADVAYVGDFFPDEKEMLTSFIEAFVQNQMWNVPRLEGDTSCFH